MWGPVLFSMMDELVWDSLFQGLGLGGDDLIWQGTPFTFHIPEAKLNESLCTFINHRRDCEDLGYLAQPFESSRLVRRQS